MELPTVLELRLKPLLSHCCRGLHGGAGLLPFVILVLTLSRSNEIVRRRITTVTLVVLEKKVLDGF